MIWWWSTATTACAASAARPSSRRQASRTSPRWRAASTAGRWRSIRACRGTDLPDAVHPLLEDRGKDQQQHRAANREQAHLIEHAEREFQRLLLGRVLRGRGLAGNPLPGLMRDR